jgi:hypothetical protein
MEGKKEEWKTSKLTLTIPERTSAITTSKFRATEGISIETGSGFTLT